MYVHGLYVCMSVSIHVHVSAIMTCMRITNHWQEHPRLLRTNSVSPTPSPSTPSQHQPSLAVSPQQRPATADPNNNATNNATNTSNTTNNDDLGPLPVSKHTCTGNYPQCTLVFSLQI